MVLETILSNTASRLLSALGTPIVASDGSLMRGAKLPAPANPVLAEAAHVGPEGVSGQMDHVEGGRQNSHSVGHHPTSEKTVAQVQSTVLPNDPAYHKGP